MWGLLLGNQSSHVESFATFLTEKQPVKVINRDQWQSFLEFATTVSEDFHDYDEMSACKYILGCKSVRFLNTNMLNRACSF
jgi:Cullin binding